MDNDTKAPKGDEQLAREKFLRDQQAAMTPPEPEVEGEATKVPRSELVTPLPKEGKDVDAWKPGSQKHIE